MLETVGIVARVRLVLATVNRGGLVIVPALHTNAGPISRYQKAKRSLQIHSLAIFAQQGGSQSPAHDETENSQVCVVQYEAA